MRNPDINVQDFVDSIKDNPKKIIAWCKAEIKQYENLIKILEVKKPLRSVPAKDRYEMKLDAKKKRK